MLEAGTGRVKERCNHELLKPCGRREARAPWDHCSLWDGLSEQTLPPAPRPILVVLCWPEACPGHALGYGQVWTSHPSILRDVTSLGQKLLPKHNPCGTPWWLPAPTAAHLGTAMALLLCFSGNNSNRDTHGTQQSHLFYFLFIQDTIILAGVLPSKNIPFTFITLVYYLRALSLNSEVDTLLLK